jgi:zinc transport system substrate-binding protein
MITAVMSRTCRIVIAVLSLIAGMGTPAFAASDTAPRIVVSILPIHSLVAGMTEGIASPTLLIDRPASPHDYSLRPSDAKALNEADLVVWVGPSLESFLVKPLATLGKKAKIVTLTRDPAIDVIHVGEKQGSKPTNLDIDPHIWLDPENAIAITRVVRDALKRIDPANAAAYDSNAQRQIDDLLDLVQSTSAMAKGGFAGRPAILYHDSLRYFARRYGLEIAGTILSGDKLPGGRHMSDLRAALADQNIRCVFTEPEFSPAMAQALIEGSRARLAEIDPLGIKLQPGPRAYRLLIQGIFGGLLNCLRS